MNFPHYWRTNTCGCKRKCRWCGMTQRITGWRQGVFGERPIWTTYTETKT